MYGIIFIGNFFRKNNTLGGPIILKHYFIVVGYLELFEYNLR
jgi:hypothetical protein